MEYSYNICFTETNVAGALPSERITEYLDEWSDIHKQTLHGFAICFNTDKIWVIQEYEVKPRLEVLSLLLEVQNEQLLETIIYRLQGSIGLFINQLSGLLNILPKEHQTLLLGDFNLDQKSPENVKHFGGLFSKFSFHQRSNHSTHIHGGILGLLFDNGSATDAS